MSLINSQVKSLKLNVTNIQSYLVSSNEKMRKLRSDKNNLIKTEQDKTKKAQKEKKIESSSSGLSAFGARVAKGVAKPFIGLFDRIKEFLGLIIAGIIVNNLPKLIEGITKTVSDISKIISQIGSFIGKNKWMLEGIKFMTSMLGIAVWPIIDLVKTITPSEQNRITKDSERIQDEFGRLDKDLEGDDEEINRRLNQYERNQARQTATTTPPTTTQTSRNTPTGSPDRSYREPSTPTRTDSRVPKFAAGGRVEPRRTDTGTQPAARKSMTAATTTGRQTDGSVRSKRAVQTVNYFSFFNNNTRASEAIVEKDAKNKDTFKEILTSLKTIQDIRKQIGDENVPDQRPGTSPGQPSPGEPINVDPNEVIGTLGSTGQSTGPHIHIENHTTRGGRIPLDVKNNILVSGSPLMNLFGPEDGNDGIGNYAWRRSRRNPSGFHAGEDYAGTLGSPITLKGGLKFVQYIPDDGGGYGNRVIIQAPDGTQYSLNHLNSGPRNLRALQERQNQQSTQRFGSQTGQASYYGPGFHGNSTPSGSTFNQNALTAAHNTLPFGTRVKVTNTSNGKTVVVTITDRGPYAVDNNGNAIRPLRPNPTRIIDLSTAAMRKLGGINSGVINVRIDPVDPTQTTQNQSTSNSRRHQGLNTPGYGNTSLLKPPTSQDKDIVVAFQHIFNVG